MTSESKLVSVVEKNHYDFSYVPDGQTETIVLCRAINTIPYYHGSLWVRLHSARIGASVTAHVYARGVLPSRHDQQEFVLDDATYGSFIDSGDFGGKTAPWLAAAYSTDELPAFLQLELTVTQPTPATYAAFELSVDLLLRAS
jgi:hypothetical protein